MVGKFDQLREIMGYIRDHAVPVLRRNPFFTGAEYAQEYSNRESVLKAEVNDILNAKSNTQRQLSRLNAIVKYSDILKQRSDITSRELLRLGKMQQQANELNIKLEKLNQSYEQKNKKLKQKEEQRKYLQGASYTPNSDLDQLFPYEKQLKEAAIQRGLNVLQHPYKRYRVLEVWWMFSLTGGASTA